LGRIPLVLGMPVIVMQNHDVNGGVVNGSIGTLTKIRYTIDDQQRRKLLSCIVHLPHTSDNRMHDLQPGQYPIMEDTVDIKFQH
ncbi:hypothetical protein LXA43DRAFT_841504, partial [Ganoderma leucocontextum]